MTATDTANRAVAARLATRQYVTRLRRLHRLLGGILARLDTLPPGSDLVHNVRQWRSSVLRRINDTLVDLIDA